MIFLLAHVSCGRSMVCKWDRDVPENLSRLMISYPEQFHRVELRVTWKSTRNSTRRILKLSDTGVIKHIAAFIWLYLRTGNLSSRPPLWDLGKIFSLFYAYLKARCRLPVWNNWQLFIRNNDFSPFVMNETLSGSLSKFCVYGRGYFRSKC